MRQRGSGCSWFFFFLLTIIILSGAWLYTNWQSSQAVLPPGLTINGIRMGGMTRDQALEAIAQAYTTPITVTYVSEVTMLLPEMVDLSLDAEATAENLDEALAGRSEATSFIDYVLDWVLRRKPEEQKVNAIVTYSRERVNAFLERTAQKYDHPPQKPVSLPEAGTFRPPQGGTELNIDASLPLLIEAILSAVPEERQAALVVKTEPAPEASMDILADAISASLSDFNGVAGLFSKDLKTGRELCMNCDVAFAGLSTLKIGVVLDRYRTLNAPPNAETTALISATLTASDNAAANLLLAQIGAGDPYSGALQVTDFFWSLGLKSTFLAVPYDLKEGVEPPGFVTPANSRADITTDPDPYIQTTPTEMGLLLEGLYQCAQGGGFLRLIYPQEITPGECQDILAWLEHNQMNVLLGAGMPEGARIAHKHGWTGDTHGDIAVIYGPETDFVLTVFLYQPEWLVWEDSKPTFAAIGQLVYRFFNGEN